MTKIGAFISDLDGTLLNADHTLPREYGILHQFLESKNVPFIVASARPLGNIRKLFQGYPMPAGAIACDGAIAAVFSRGLICDYIEKPLPVESARKLFDALCEFEFKPVLFLTRAHDFTVAVLDHEPTLVDGLSRSDSTRPIVQIHKRDAGNILANIPVRAISVLGPKTDVHQGRLELLRAHQDIPDTRIYSYDETRFGDHQLAWLDIVGSSTKKEEAISYCLKAIGATGKDIIACGNGHNDINMLASAKRAFCPANSVAPVLSICKNTTAPCNEGGAFAEWLHGRLTIEFE